MGISQGQQNIHVYNFYRVACKIRGVAFKDK